MECGCACATTSACGLAHRPVSSLRPFRHPLHRRRHPWAVALDEGLVDRLAAGHLQRLLAIESATDWLSIALLEAGWATTAEEFGDRTGEAEQERYYREIEAWGRQTNTTIFFFEAFDEPWKGEPNRPLGAEKHWGIYFVDRIPKQVMR